MRGGAFGREESGAALAKADAVAAAFGQARQVRVRGAEARLVFVLAGVWPDVAGARGVAAAILRMEGGGGAAFGEQQDFPLGAAGRFDVRPFQTPVPLAVRGVAEVAARLGADGERP